MKKTAALLLIIIVFAFGQIPHTFTAGTVAKAGEVNDNFTYIMGRIDSLKSENTNLKAQLDTLASIAVLPIGTIVASMMPPEKFLEIAGDYWHLADSSVATDEYILALKETFYPDLRGVFLRGVNAGKDSTIGDPAGERTAGNYQVDAFESHTHVVSTAPGDRSPFRDDAGKIYQSAQDSNWKASQTRATTSTGDAETRPRNVAVYWYVKVK